METSATNPGYALDDAIPMHVDVIVEAGRKDDSRTEIESRLHRLVRDLGDDLSIRIHLDLHVRPPNAGDLGNGQNHAVQIDDTPCRVDRTLGLPADSPPSAVADAILETLIQNRTLLVTDRLLDAVCRSFSGEIGASPPNGIVRLALQEAFESCFNLHTALELCRVALNDSEDPNYETELRAAMRFAKTIQVELGRTLYDVALKAAQDPEPGKEHAIDDMAKMMRDGLYYELGIRLPPLEFVFGETLEDQEFRIRVNRLRGPMHRGLGPDSVLVNDTVDRLTLLNIKGSEAVNPANGAEAAIIPLEYADICEQAGLTTWDSAGYMILSISATLRQHASVFFTIAQAEYNLMQLDQAFPMLVFNVLERYPVVAVTKVLRGLLTEEISIRDLRSVLEALLELNGTTDVAFDRYIVFTVREAHLATSARPVDALTEEEIVEFVRNAMRRYISHKYTRGGGTLVVYLMEPTIEARIQEPATLDASERNQLIEAVESEVGNLPPTAQNPVILTATGVRARLRRELEKEFPHLAVLSYQDLSPEMNIQPIARISWPS